MNQILVTKKLYITPELKRKKKVYKFNFFISVFLICILVSFYIYAEYDRNKSEEASQALLSEFNENSDILKEKSNILIAVLNDTNEDSNANDTSEDASQKAINSSNVQTTKEGFKYTTIASINIPKINVNYPILEGETGSLEETESIIKIAPAKFWGSNPNKVGNFCIVGHNYLNSKFFSKVPTLENGDIIEITDENKQTMSYSVYTKYEVVPEDVSCLDQETNGRKEITLITCTDDSQKRVIVKARAI